MENYRIALATFVRSFIQLRNVCERVMDGEIVEGAEKLAKEVSHNKEELLMAQEQMGFEPNLHFLEDSNYAGFRIENVRIVGSQYEAYKKVTEWSQKFLDGKIPSVYFEVANLITFLLNMKEVFAEKAKEEMYINTSVSVVERRAVA